MQPVSRIAIRLLGAALIVGVLAALTGCDLQENADVEKGRALFLEKCGSCHTLAEAGTGGQNGPDLDLAFQEARAQGMDQDTIEGVVESQIAFPRPASPDQVNVYMPADLVTGDDATAVAAYVASVAGIPGIMPPQMTPPELFAAQCGSCHALSAAGTTGTIGPDLDQVLPGQSPAQIEESIIDPDKAVSPGFEAGVMPSTFGQTIQPDDMKALIQYLMQSIGK